MIGKESTMEDVATIGIWDIPHLKPGLLMLLERTQSVYYYYESASSLIKKNNYKNKWQKKVPTLSSKLTVQSPHSLRIAPLQKEQLIP